MFKHRGLYKGPYFLSRGRCYELFLTYPDLESTAPGIKPVGGSECRSYPGAAWDFLPSGSRPCGFPERGWSVASWSAAGVRWWTWRLSMWRAGSGQTSGESSSLAGGPLIIQNHGTSVEGEQKKTQNHHSKSRCLKTNWYSKRWVDDKMTVYFTSVFQLLCMWQRYIWDTYLFFQRKQWSEQHITTNFDSELNSQQLYLYINSGPATNSHFLYHSNITIMNFSYHAIYYFI